MNIYADWLGDVGIGSTPLGQKLYINGNLYVNGPVDGVGKYNNVSDARLKKDITPVSGGLGLIEQLRSVRFHWREPEEREIGKNLKLSTDEPQIGFIAQEVQKVLPEAITQGKDGIYTMQETAIVPVLVEAVQELKADNDRLNSLVTLQGREIDELKAERPDR
jgi:hypothetical protein